MVAFVEDALLVVDDQIDMSFGDELGLGFVGMLREANAFGDPHEQDLIRDRGLDGKVIVPFSGKLVRSRGYGSVEEDADHWFSVMAAVAGWPGEDRLVHRIVGEKAAETVHLAGLWRFKLLAGV